MTVILLAMNTPQASRIPTPIFAIILTVGLALVCIASGLAISTRSFLKQSVATQGTVTELAERVDREDNSVSYAPVFTFDAADGHRYRVVSHVSSNPPGFHVGEAVRVLYEPGNPQGARIDTFVQLWLTPLICGALGVVFSAVGAGLVFYRKWPGRRDAALALS